MKYVDGFKVENQTISGVWRKKQVVSRIVNSLKSSFYHEVEPPTLCRYSDFRDINMSEKEENALIKFTDTDGSLMTLAFNLTVAIDEIASFEYLKNVDSPLRLYYKGKAYTLFRKEGLDRIYEQVGAELINVSGIAADAEIVSKAIDSVLACRIKAESFFVELNHAGFINGILESYSLTEKEQSLLLDNIARKNTFSILKSKQNSDLYDKVEELLTSVPKLFGKPEQVLSFAEGFAEKKGSKKALETVFYIKKLCSLLSECGYGDYVRLDLTAKENHKNIYNGIMFQGMSAELGVPLFSGGRYDGFIGRNNANCGGKSIPAIGFAVSIDNVLKIANTHGEQRAKQTPSAVIACEPNREELYPELLRLAKGLSEKGTVENLFGMDKAEFDSLYVGVKGIEKYYITESGELIKESLC